MIRKNTDIKAAVEKVRKLRALQQKAAAKLDKIAKEASGKPAKKKRAGQTCKKKVKRTAKKGSFWKRLFSRKKPKKAGRGKRG